MFTSNAEAMVQRGSDATMKLTIQAAQIAQEVMSKIKSGVVTEEEVKSSMASHDAMDTLLEKARPFEASEYEWLQELTDDTVDKMIKSQQSKRSRSKSKSMTESNYNSMMVGAIAENMLRASHNKPKGSVGSGVASTGIEYSDEKLAELAENQEDLRRHLRNVQSRKSIMKSKASFDEASEGWQQLLKAEEQLKNIRVGAVTGRTVTPIKELLAGIGNINDLKSGAAKELLEKINSLL
jgi:enoyl reductase-like protein